MPVLSLDKKVFDYAEDKNINLKILNNLGKELNNYKTALSYKLKSEEKKAVDEYELENNLERSELSLEKSDFKATIPLHLSSIIKGPGKYKLELRAQFTTISNSTFSIQHNTEEINSVTKVKLNHLKMKVTRTKVKADEQEITVEYPKRSFKSIKATQQSVIKLKVKLDSKDNQVNKIEQIFLRVRHSEYGRSYSAYVSGYDAVENYYQIHFDIGDSVYFI